MEEKVIENKPQTEEISLRDFIVKILEWYRYLLSKWVTIIIWGVLGGVLGFAYAYIKKAEYTAYTSFVLEEGDKGGGLGQYGALASMAGFDIGGSGGGIFQGDNIIELYKSRSMIQKTLLTEVEFDGKKQLLVDRYISINKLREKWAKNPGLKNIMFKPFGRTNIDPEFPGLSRLQDSVLGTIVIEINKNYLNVVKPDKKLSIIKAEVRAKDELFAKIFDEQIVKNVNDFYVQTKTKKSVDNINIMQHKVDSVQKVLNGYIYTAAAVADATPNLNVTRQVQRIVPVQRSQFGAETNKAILGELVKSLELSKVSLLKETPLIQVIDQPILPLDKEKSGIIKWAIIGAILFVFLTSFILCIRVLIKQSLQTAVINKK